MESCGGDVCACGSEVYAVCWWLLEHWNTGTTGTLEQLEHWNNWNNRDNKKVVVNSVGKMYGGCGLYREDVWWLWTL